MSAGGFNFSKPPADGGTFSFGAAKAPAGGAFSFGGTPGSTPAPTPAPSFGSTPAPSFGSTPAPSFGGSAAPAPFGSPAPAAFGGSTATSNKTSFSFGNDDDDKKSNDGGSNKKTSFGGSGFGSGGGGDNKPAFGGGFGGGGSAGDSKPAFGGAADSKTALGGGGGDSKPVFGGGFGGGSGDNKPTLGGGDSKSAFGGGNAGAPAANAPTTGTAAPAFGGVTFGGTTPGPAPTFGAAATPNQSKTSDPTTPNTPAAPAPVATPHPAGAAPVPTGTPAPTAAATAPTPSTLEYKTLSVEQILNKFQKELERDVLIYKEQARVVSERDAILRDAQRDIQIMTSKLHRCLIQQSELDKTVASITAFQDEMERTLLDCESSVNELFRSQGNVAAVPSDFERENIFKAAEEVESRLQQVEETFQIASSHINEGLTANLDSDVASIMTVLFQHQLSLQEVEQTSRRMQKEIDEAEKALSRFT